MQYRVWRASVRHTDARWVAVIPFEKLIRVGDVRDYADLARLGHVTRARMTQIMALTMLPPDLQELLLFLPPTVENRPSISERSLRSLTRIVRWDRQREAWGAIVSRS
jgi:hypothetical protein